MTEDEAIALDELPAQLETPLLFPAPAGELLSLDNFRRREWAPAIETSGVATPHESTTFVPRSRRTLSPRV